MRVSQEQFLEPVIERGQRFVENFSAKYFQKPSLDEVMSHLLGSSPLGKFPQLTGAAREQMAEFLESYTLGAPTRYPDAEVG